MQEEDCSNMENQYTLGCNTAEEWQQLHQELINDGCTDSCIPSRCVECADLKEFSETRASYLLTDEEAAELKNHPSIHYIHLDPQVHTEAYPKPRPRELHNLPIGVIPEFRYSSNTKQYRDFSNGGNLLPASPDSTDISRCGYSLLRHSQKNDRWQTGLSTGARQVLTSRVPGHASGYDVDVIVSDDGCWFGHPEFQSNAGTSNSPVDYIGGNVLKAGWHPAAVSATTGTCDLLDLILDAPYYIDPEWFEGSPGSRLMTRWDGTTVPVESVAKSWWSTSNQRSAKFASIGTVNIPANYTRANCNGSSSTVSVEGNHGTACASLTYGRTMGWAYNSNKFFIDSIGNFSPAIEVYFDILKIFHQNKPVNLKYGNRNPTVSSNSWGYRATGHLTNGFYFYRQGTSGGIGVSYTSGTAPGYFKYVGTTGDSGRMKGEHAPSSIVTAGNECINSGVIFVGAAGNSNQKQVSPSHPDYNNYWATTAQGSAVSLTSATHNEFGYTAYNTTNRRGFPQQLGRTASGEYPVINVGALDDDYQPDGKERKVNYSDMGNEIDIYAAADGTLAANRGYTAAGIRADTYPGLATIINGTIGIAVTAAYMSGDTLTFGSNTGRRITTTTNNSVSIVSIANTIVGPSGVSTVTASIGNTSYGGNDDGFWDITIPWNINFGSVTTNQLFVNSNSYVTFGARSSVTDFDFQINWTYNATSVAYPKIYITASDSSCQRIYYQTSGLSPDRTFRVRYEGHTSYNGGVLGSPTVVWEMTFYENAPSQIDLQIGANGKISQASDASFGGTSAACPVAAGFISTLMQDNRNWTWRDVRKYLKSSIITQTSTGRFYQGNESRTANDPNWADLNSLEGGKSRVIYNPRTNS